MSNRRHGATIVELLASLGCIVAMLAMAGVATGGDGHGAKTRARTLRDATHLKGIHQALIISSREFDGLYPRPGLIDRLPVTLGDQRREIPGRGEEDPTQNTTASLFAALIVLNYFDTVLCVSPVERNPAVTLCEAYDYEAYDPAGDVYWDDAFASDLSKKSHVSYAHLVMSGQRMTREWRETFNASAAVLGNRGPLVGEPDAASFTCGPHGHWAGNVVFNDNRVELLTSMEPDVSTRVVESETGEKTRAPDNLFAMETGPQGSDMILSFTRSMTSKGPSLQHD